MTVDQTVPNSTGTQPPRIAVPAGAVDCHHHIFDPRFPKSTGKPMRAVGRVEDYLLLRQRLGLSRSVVVAPASYGYDNACLLDALDRMGDSVRGVAICRHDISKVELKALHDRRVRGIRVYLAKHDPPTAEQLLSLGGRVAEMGWHIEIMPSVAEKVIEWEPVLASLPCPIVIDHLGYIPQPGGHGHPALATLLRLVDRRKAYVKLSGVYFTSKSGFPGYSDVNELARRLVSTAPDRMLWGTDWPHSGEAQKPDDALLLDQIAEWAPAESTRKEMLVDNPNAVYWR